MLEASAEAAPSPTSARPRPPPARRRAARRASSAAIRSAAREARGPAHASGELFEGATWFLTPVAGTDAERYRLVHGFVTDLGAIPVAIDPEAHDRLVALTSHLPHALANLLVNQAGAARIEGHDPLPAAGGSLRDMTRVAGANPRIWVDIFLDNAPGAARGAGRAPAPRRAARGGARGRRRRLPRALDRRGGGQPPPDARGGISRPGELQRLRVHVPDRPGVLAGDHPGARRRADQHRGLRAPALLAGARRRAARARRGRAEAERAAALLEAQGYGVVGLAGARTSDDARRAGDARWSGTSPSPATSRSPTAPCCSARSPRARRRSRASARSADTESTLAAVRALGAEVEEDGDVAARRRRGPARAARAGRADRLRQRRHAASAAAGHPRRPARALRAHRRRVAALAADRPRSPSRSADGRRGRDDGRAAPLVIQGDAARDPLRAPRRERPGEVLPPPRGALREGRDARRAGADAGPHGAHAALAGATVRRRPTTSRSARAAARAPEVDVPGDFSSAAPFLVAATLLAGLGADDPRRRHQPDAHRPARRARADGRPHHGVQPAPRRRRAGRRPGYPLGAAHRDDDRGERRAAARRRAAPLRARRRLCPRRERGARRGRAARRRRPTGSRRSTNALRALGARVTRRTTVHGARRPDPPQGRHARPPRRPSDRDARRCRGLVSREGVRLEGAETAA